MLPFSVLWMVSIKHSILIVFRYFWESKNTQFLLGMPPYTEFFLVFLRLSCYGTVLPELLHLTRTPVTALFLISLLCFPLPLTCLTTAGISVFLTPITHWGTFLIKKKVNFFKCLKKQRVEQKGKLLSYMFNDDSTPAALVHSIGSWESPMLLNCCEIILLPASLKVLSLQVHATKPCHPYECNCSQFTIGSLLFFS